MYVMHFVKKAFFILSGTILQLYINKYMVLVNHGKFLYFFFLNQNLVKKNIVFKNRLSHSGRCVYMMYFFPSRKLFEFSIQRYVIPVIRAHSINILRSYREKEIEREKLLYFYPARRKHMLQYL